MRKSIGIIFLLAVAAISSAVSGQVQTNPVFELPVLMTSAGQSGDAPIASVLFKRAEIGATFEKLATVKNLEGQKTLVLVLGASMKGLGAAGLDSAKEFERISALVAEAKKNGISILCMHVGGEARRGDLTDQMVKTFLPAGKAAVVVKSGNKDGLFTKLAKEAGIPLIEVEKTLDAIEPLKQLFKK
jgi:hypothetical protein